MKQIVLEEMHITIYISPKLPDKDCLRIHRTLKSRSFRSKLDRAVRQLFGRYPTLRLARTVISQ